MSKGSATAWAQC